MFNMGAMPSLADIAAVTGNNRNNNGWADGGGWWAWILIFALFGGWGNGNWGFGGNGGQGAYDTQAVVQRGFDTQAIISKLDGINNGVCSLGYDQLAQMNNLGTTVMQTGFDLQQAINADTVSGDKNACQLSHQISDCCCETKSAIADVKYQMATDACALKTQIFQTGQDIMQNDNANFRALNDQIRDGFTRLEMNQKDQRIAELERELNKCDRDTALQGTASYIINTVRPTPTPSWNVQNPWAGCNCHTGCNSCGNSSLGCCA